MDFTKFDVEVGLGDSMINDQPKLFLYLDVIFNCVMKKNFEVRCDKQGILLLIHDMDERSLKVFTKMAAEFSKSYKFIKKEISYQI